MYRSGRDLQNERAAHRPLATGTFGADLKLALTSNLVLDTTIVAALSEIEFDEEQV